MEDGFKLLAIRPQLDCDKKFLKNLNPGTIYKFYGDYFYYDHKDKEIIESVKEIHKVKFNSIVPDNLYSSKHNNLNINVSAIVGKNGAGKSSLLELLYVACYIISAKAKIITGVESIKEAIDKREFKWTNLYERNQITEIEKIYKDVDVEIVYLINNRLRILKLDKGIISVRVFKKRDDYYWFKELEINSKEQIFSFLKYFFYTISINYSQYGLNEKSLGIWAKYLFHKNDGYQTPLVVNPFREKGNIDVNNELHLSQTRFITNLILTDNKITVNNKKPEKIEFQVNGMGLSNNLETFLLKNNLDEFTFFENIYNSIYNEKSGRDLKFERNNKVQFSDVQINYLFSKIIKIRDQYYKEFVLGKNKEIQLERFLEFLSILSLDNSHVTLKLRQTLNNIRFNILSDENGGAWKKRGKHYSITFSSLLLKIISLKKNNNFLEYEELIPIACFTPTIYIQNHNEDRESVNKMESLSSGEQHQIHTIQSILYHILNLDSVHNNNRKNVKYRNLNIIFDEIELYFHPEFQRTFLFELLLNIKSLPLKKIKNINILFCTHSPFILSDILKQATLKLKNGDAETYVIDGDNSYGANIHDLLREDFYLSKGFMGEYARDKTASLIHFLDKSNIDENELKKVRNEYFWDEENALKYIEIIGEPLLRDTLRELYFKKYNNNIIINREIERLEKLKKNE